MPSLKNPSQALRDALRAATGIANTERKAGYAVSLLDEIPAAEHAAIRAGGSSYDCRAAFLAAIQRATTNAGLYYVGSPKVRIPAGDYYFAGTVEIKRTVVIEGEASGMAGGVGTRLRFASGSHGIIIQRYNTTGAGVEDPPTKGGDASIIRGVALKGAGASGHGIWLRARAKLEDLQVDGFGGNGIQIIAGAGIGGIEEGNANNWAITTARITNCGGHGLFVDGADANAGIGTGIDATGNGMCGIYDSSFLGNTWIGCHVDSNGLKAGVHYAGNRYYCRDPALAGSTTPGTNAAVWGLIGAGGIMAGYPEWQNGGSYTIGYGYHTDDPNCASVFVGCYSEGGWSPNRILAPSLVLGGAHGGFDPDSTAPVMTGALGRLRLSTGIENRSGAASYVLGEGAAITATHDDTAPLSWRVQFDGPDMVLRYANSGAATAFLATGPQTARTFGRAAAVPYALAVDRLFVGSGNNARQITTGSAAPAEGAWGAGDRCLNISPAVGQPKGWVCTVAGTPGTWVSEGNL